MSDEPLKKGIKTIIKVVKYFNIFLIVVSVIAVIFIALVTMMGSTASSKFSTIPGGPVNFQYSSPQSSISPSNF